MYEQPYQILGSQGTGQFLQILLMPYQSITTNEQAVMYTSEHVEIKERCTFRERIKNYLLGRFPELSCDLKNNTSTMQYVGLMLNGGRILVHDCSTFN